MLLPSPRGQEAPEYLAPQLRRVAAAWTTPTHEVTSQALSPTTTKKLHGSRFTVRPLIMKLITGLIAALAGCATAAQQSAEVYIVSRGDASSTPAVTPSLARLLFLQRLASNGQGFLQHDIPIGVDTEKAISFLNRFGKSIPSLFSAGETKLPNQLVLMLDVMSDSHMKELRKALSISPSFTIADPPAEKAHKDLIELDLIEKLGVADGNKCSIEQIANPMEDCWNGKSSAVARYSMNKASFRRRTRVEHTPPQSDTFGLN